MPSGLQIWDASGNLVLDTTVRTGTFVGALSTGTSNGSLYVADLARGTPFAYVHIPSALTTYSLTPAVWVDGQTVTWAFLGGDGQSVPVNADVTYGYF